MYRVAEVDTNLYEVKTALCISILMIKSNRRVRIMQPRPAAILLRVCVQKYNIYGWLTAMFLFLLIEPHFDSWPATTCHWKQFTACSLTSVEGRPKPPQHSIVTIKDILEGFFKTYQGAQLNVLPFLLLLPVVLGIILHSFCIVYGDIVCMTQAKYLSLIRRLNTDLFALGLNLKRPPWTPVTYFFKYLNRDVWRYAGIWVGFFDFFFFFFSLQQTALTKSSYITFSRYFMPNTMFHILITETMPIMLFLFSQFAMREEAQRWLRMQRG